MKPSGRRDTRYRELMGDLADCADNILEGDDNPVTGTDRARGALVFECGDGVWSCHFISNGARPYAVVALLRGVIEHLEQTSDPSPRFDA